MRTDESMNTDSEIKSALATAHRFLGCGSERADPRLRTLLYGIRAGLLRYPDDAPSPAGLMERGARLERALREGDRETVRALGVQAKAAASQAGAGGAIEGGVAR